jgi:hypothetical protein
MRPNSERGIDAFFVSSEISGFEVDSSRSCAKGMIIMFEAVSGYAGRCGRTQKEKAKVLRNASRAWFIWLKLNTPANRKAVFFNA